MNRWGGTMRNGAGWFAAIVWVVLFSAARPVAGADRAPTPITTIFIVRHAEKAATPKNDPPLTEAGRVRAALLSRVLRSAKVQAVYSSGFARTDQTAAPVAEVAGVKTTRYDARHSPALAAVIKRDHPGGVVLVVGHSNTIPGLLGALGVARVEVPVLGDDEYDNLFIVTISENHVSMVRLRFGAPAPQ